MYHSLKKPLDTYSQESNDSSFASQYHRRNSVEKRLTTGNRERFTGRKAECSMSETPGQTSAELEEHRGCR